MPSYLNSRRQICPHCGSGDIHTTRWKGLVERCVLYLWGLRPYQCKYCYKRFYMPPIPERRTAVKPAERKLA